MLRRTHGVSLGSFVRLRQAVEAQFPDQGAMARSRRMGCRLSTSLPQTSNRVGTMDYRQLPVQSNTLMWKSFLSTQKIVEQPLVTSRSR